MPKLAAIVAFEHHLRVDGTGYPAGVQRTPINLATGVCAIADAYDAMRSTRVYQPANPAARIMDIMVRNTGEQFDEHLVRRFIQLMGVYPPATLVRLSNGSVGFVVDTGGDAVPVVKVLIGPDGVRLTAPVLQRLASDHEVAYGRDALTIEAALDASLYDLDPASYV
jgi:hypothetical protein